MTSTPDGTTAKNGVKTLAIKLEPHRHAQLSLIAQVAGSTITDEIRQAIDEHIETVKSSPDFAVKAADVLAELDRDAAARRDAVATLLTPADGPSEKAGGPARKQPRAGGSAR